MSEGYILTERRLWPGRNEAFSTQNTKNFLQPFRAGQNRIGHNKARCGSSGPKEGNKIAECPRLEEDAVTALVEDSFLLGLSCSSC